MVEDTIELHADPETASHLPDAEEVARLRDPHVIPISVVIRNLGTPDVFIESGPFGLQLSDGRVLRVAEAVQTARAPAFELEQGTGSLNWIGELGQAHDFPPVIVFLMVVVAAMPMWLPPYLIARHVKRTSREQRNRNAALARLGVRLAKGQAAGGVLHFAVEGDLPDTLATATLIVPVRRADTGEEHSLMGRLRR